MGLWESVNKSISGKCLAFGEDATLTTKSGFSLPVKAIISRDSAKIVPDPNEDGFYEIMDAATGQYRTKIDIGTVDNSPLNITTAVLGGQIVNGDETWIIEYVVGRDTYVLKTLCRKA